MTCSGTKTCCYPTTNTVRIALKKRRLPYCFPSLWCVNCLARDSHNYPQHKITTSAVCLLTYVYGADSSHHNTVQCVLCNKALPTLSLVACQLRLTLPAAQASPRSQRYLQAAAPPSIGGACTLGTRGRRLMWRGMPPGAGRYGPAPNHTALPVAAPSRACRHS